MTKRLPAIFMIILAALFVTAPLTGASADAAFLNYTLKREYLFKGGVPINDSAYQALINDLNVMMMSYESAFSLEEGSDVYNINRAQAGEKIKVGRETIELLQLAYEYYIITEGAYNPAVKNLVNLWGFSSENEGNYSTPREEPTKEEIAAAMEHTDFSEVIIDAENLTVTKNFSDIRLDLGGIAKGYIADKMTERIKQDCDDALLTLMSNTSVIGKNKSEEVERDFIVAITDPRNLSEQCFFINASDISVSTSGDYERYYIYGGKRYSHIIDPFTGKPADKGVISATVACESGAMADALSTACFVLGAYEGAKLINNLGVSAAIVTADYNCYFLGDADFRITADEIAGYPKSMYTLKEESEIPKIVIPDPQESNEGETDIKKFVVYGAIIILAAATVGIILYKGKNNGQREQNR